MFEKRRDRMLSGLSTIPGVTCVVPDGAFYAFPDFSEAIARLDARAGVKNDGELAALLPEKARVAVVPGEAFGAPGHLRLSYATDEASIDEGLRRIRAVMAELTR